MITRTALALIGLAAATGCGSRGSGGPAFKLEKTTVAFGETPWVTYEEPVPEVEGQKYWITVVPAGSPDSAWGDYGYLVPGETRQALAVPGHGGDWEVRLHDQYPRNSYRVMQRAALRVEGGPAAPAPTAPPAEAAAPAGGTAGEAAPDASPSPPQARLVTFTVEPNATVTKFGPVSAEARALLHMRRAARDGGAFYEESAAAGRKFLVLHFPETERRKEQIVYEDDKVKLYLEGRLELDSHSVASGGVNSEPARQRGDPLRFETEIWMSTINEANAYPFAVAFDVPAETRRAWLRVEDQVVELAVP